MSFYYIPLVVITLYYAVYYYFTRTFNHWKKRNINGPEPIPLFGNLKESTLRRKNVGIEIQEIYDKFPNEKVVGLYRLTSPSLLIRDLDVIKHIMIKDFDMFADRGVEFSSEGLGLNLFHAGGETWRALRSRFTPIFTSGKLKRMFNLMNERADIFLDYFSNKAKDQTEFEVHSLVQKYTVSSICACAFGLNMKNLDDKMEVLEMIDKLVMIPNYWFDIDTMFPGLLKKLNITASLKPIQTFFDNLVTDILTVRGGKPSERNDFMDLILELRQMGNVKSSNTGDNLEITNDIIAAQAYVFYLAGFETSATTVTFLLYEIAKNPDIQNKLIAEIDEITEANGGEVTYESMNEMKYLQKVFDETLRMYSIVEPLQRQANVDYKIPGTDVVIEKGQIVLISPRGIHHDEKYYPNPEIFDPHRFDADEVGKRHPCAYLPFGLGQRNCIGMRFGKLQSALCVAKMLRKFRVEPSKNTKMDLAFDGNRIFVSPKDGIYLNIVPRK